MTISRLFPARWHNRLIDATFIGSPNHVTAEINRITDEMAAAGLVRPRTDTSRLAEWQAQRDAARAVSAAKAKRGPAK